MSDSSAVIAPSVTVNDVFVRMSILLPSASSPGDPAAHADAVALHGDLGARSTSPSAPALMLRPHVVTARRAADRGSGRPRTTAARGAARRVRRTGTQGPPATGPGHRRRARRRSATSAHGIGHQAGTAPRTSSMVKPRRSMSGRSASRSKPKTPRRSRRGPGGRRSRSPAGPPRGRRSPRRHPGTGSRSAGSRRRTCTGRPPCRTSRRGSWSPPRRRSPGPSTRSSR